MTTTINETENADNHATISWLLKHSNLPSSQNWSTLTKLNLPNCGLSHLPDDLPSVLPHLSILFCPNNHFQELPPVVGQCQQLQMISFKSNGMTSIHPDALQPQLRWLILTGNAIPKLPETIGRCRKLQKLMLSGNALVELPESIDQLINLELVRLACNRLQEAPVRLLQLAQLKWAAFSGNPFIDKFSQKHNHPDDDDTSLPVIDDDTLDHDTWPILGQGAGGITRQASMGEEPVAVKTYCGHLTSDGSPQDEKRLSVLAATLQDPSLIRLLGQTKKGALIMEFLQEFEPLAGPPSLESCSRDVYDDQAKSSLSEAFCWKIAISLLHVLDKLHQKGICHGDFYGHNILIQEASQQVKLSDFGAAYFYDKEAEYAAWIRRVEFRSFTVLVEELQSLVSNQEGTSQSQRWQDLSNKCQDPNATFEALAKEFAL